MHSNKIVFFCQKSPGVGAYILLYFSNFLKAKTYQLKAIPKFHPGLHHKVFYLE